MTVLTSLSSYEQQADDNHHDKVQIYEKENEDNRVVKELQVGIDTILFQVEQNNQQSLDFQGINTEGK